VPRLPRLLRAGLLLPSSDRRRDSGRREPRGGPQRRLALPRGARHARAGLVPWIDDGSPHALLPSVIEIFEQAGATWQGRCGGCSRSRPCPPRGPGPFRKCDDFVGQVAQIVVHASAVPLLRRSGLPMLEGRGQLGVCVSAVAQRARCPDRRAGSERGMRSWLAAASPPIR
jgi:hypothetical protein